MLHGGQGLCLIFQDQKKSILPTINENKVIVQGCGWVPNNKIAGRSGAPRPPMTDVGTETAFRLYQRKYFRKSKHLLRSEVS